MIFTFGSDLILFVIYSLNPSLSTASAPPASTRLSLADSITKEPKVSISYFKIPDALSMASLFKLLEQTISASLFVL